MPNDRTDPRRSPRIDTNDDAIETKSISCIPKLLPILRGVDMDAFLLAAIASVAVTLLLLVTNPRTMGDKLILRIRGVTSTVVTRRAFNLAWVTLSILLFTLLLMFVLAPLHPRGGAVYGLGEFVGAQRFASLALGILFGALFVLWIKQLLAIEDPKQITWVHSAEAIFLVLLLALGGFSDVLGSWAARLTQFSAAGVSFSLDPQKSGAGGGSHQRMGAGALASKDPQTRASSLYFLASIDDFIAADESYIRLISHAPLPAAGGGVPGKENDFVGHITSYAKCLDAISTETGDDEEVTRRLLPLKPALQEIAAGHEKMPADRRTRAAESVVDASMELLDALRLTYLASIPRALDRDAANSIAVGCQHLVELRCALVAPPKDADAAIDEIERCLTTAPQQRPAQVRAVEASLSGLLDDLSAFNERPYISLMLASFAWRMGDYGMGAREIEWWLRTASHAPGEPRAQWYLVRARTSLAALMENWLLTLGSFPTTMLEYHIANTRDTVELIEPMARPQMKHFLNTGKEADQQPEKDVIAAGFDERPSWNRPCALAADSAEIKLVVTYIKMAAVYAYRASQHRDYFDRYAADVRSRSHALPNLDLSCYVAAFGTDATNQLYAEILQAYAQTEMANAIRISQLPDSSAALERLKLAKAAARLGAALLSHAIELEDTAGRQSAFEASHGFKAHETKEQLEDLAQNADEAMRK
jgi:hypothetical protein